MMKRRSDRLISGSGFAVLSSSLFVKSQHCLSSSAQLSSFYWTGLVETDFLTSEPNLIGLSEWLSFVPPTRFTSCRKTGHKNHQTPMIKWKIWWNLIRWIRWWDLIRWIRWWDLISWNVFSSLSVDQRKVKPNSWKKLMPSSLSSTLKQ